LAGGRRFVLALSAAALLTFAACNATKTPSTRASETTPDQPGLFAVPADQLSHLHVTPVQRVTWTTSIHTTGTVDWDADHTTQAITQVNGPITRILVDLGARVRRGDPLLYVASPDMANAISTYKKAKNREALARRILDRAKILLDHGAMAQKDYEDTVADYNDAGTDVQNSLQALKIFDVTKQELDNAEKQSGPISPELAVRSPIDGVIVQKLVMPGQLIQAATTICFMISDVSKVWVQGHIFDRDLPSVRPGDPVEESNAALNRTFHGSVSYVGALLDPDTRTTPVRIVTDNPGGLLKKDMYVDAIIRTRTQKNVLTVPMSAILYTTENEPFVYVETQPGKFAQRLVATGAQQNGDIEVQSGVSDGDQVVSEGSVFLQFANSYQ